MLMPNIVQSGMYLCAANEREVLSLLNFRLSLDETCVWL